MSKIEELYNNKTTTTETLMQARKIITKTQQKQQRLKTPIKNYIILLMQDGSYTIKEN